MFEMIWIRFIIIRKETKKKTVSYNKDDQLK